jgi:hypothetical protein
MTRVEVSFSREDWPYIRDVLKAIGIKYRRAPVMVGTLPVSTQGIPIEVKFPADTEVKG